MSTAMASHSRVSIPLSSFLRAFSVVFIAPSACRSWSQSPAHIPRSLIHGMGARSPGDRKESLVSPGVLDYSNGLGPPTTSKSAAARPHIAVPRELDYMQRASHGQYLQ